MNSKPQPDLHPDADLLSAFAEHALPEAERSRILAHMAECGRCREIVFLARAAAEPQIASAQKPVGAYPGWFSAVFARWRVALIPASAVAAVAVVLVWARLHSAPAHIEMAQAVQPPSASPSTMTAKMAPQPITTAHLDHPAAPPPAGGPTAKTVPRVQSARRAPAAAANDELAQNQATPITPSAAWASVAPKRSLGAVHLDGHSASLALQGRPAAAPNMAVAGRPNFQWRQQVPPATGTARTALQSQGAPMPAPAPPAVVSMRGAAMAPSTAGPQFLDSSGAGPMDTFPESNGFAIMHLARHARLPSGLNTVSSAAILNRLVALDSAGAVFLSADGGKHWEAVTAQWGGKAIEVQAPSEHLYRISASQKSSEIDSVAAPASAEPEPNQDVQAATPATLQPKAALQAPPMMFKLVTDRHQTWVSTDGKVWREQ